MSFGNLGAAGSALLDGSSSLTAPANNPTTAQIPPPYLHYHYISFRGYGPNRQDGFSVLCGDEPPTITGGYAKWSVVDRPLMRGITVFQGYDPVKMSLSLRFGIWSKDGWDISGKGTDNTGKTVEQAIETLEWMAGSNFVSGASPYVYVNTYGPSGGTTNLIPYEYQTTAGVTGSTADANLWPWVIGDQIEWGKAWRAQNLSDYAGGSRIYQECTVVLTSFQGLSKPPTTQQAGTHYVSGTSGRNTMLLIAGAPQFHALSVQGLATAIQSDKHNNPIPGTRIQLKDHSLRWVIPSGKSVFVPGHNV